jgi:hypothetical protein
VSKKINRLVTDFWGKITEDLTPEEKQKLIKFSIPSEKCKTCLHANAKWYNSVLKEFACNDCVPTGCSCKLKKITHRSGLNVEDYEYILDKTGKELPCEDWVKI